MKDLKVGDHVIPLYTPECRQCEYCLNPKTNLCQAIRETQGHQLDRALTRFTIPWEWHGGEAILQSRATDSRGNIQPTRSEVIASRGTLSFYHNPCIQSWQVDQAGEVKNVYV